MNDERNACAASIELMFRNRISLINRFLLVDEADDGRQLLLDLERGWFAARNAVAGRRSNSRAAMAVGMLAAAPLLSATTLATRLGMAVKNALDLLAGFFAEGIAIRTLRPPRSMR